MWDSNCLQVNQFRGARVGIIRLCSPDLTLPGQCQPAARDHWFADPSVMQKAARNAHLSAKLSQMIIPRAQKITNKSLKLGTGAMWIRLDYLAGRFSSLWSFVVWCQVSASGSSYQHQRRHSLRDPRSSGTRAGVGDVCLGHQVGRRLQCRCNNPVCICCGQIHVLE